MNFITDFIKNKKYYSKYKDKNFNSIELLEFDRELKKLSKKSSPDQFQVSYLLLKKFSESLKEKIGFRLINSLYSTKVLSFLLFTKYSIIGILQSFFRKNEVFVTYFLYFRCWFIDCLITFFSQNNLEMAYNSHALFLYPKMWYKHIGKGAADFLFYNIK